MSLRGVPCGVTVGVTVGVILFDGGVLEISMFLNLFRSQSVGGGGGFIAPVGYCGGVRTLPEVLVNGGVPPGVTLLGVKFMGSPNSVR